MMKELESIIEKELLEVTADVMVTKLKLDAIKRITSLIIGYTSSLTLRERDYVFEYVEGYITGRTDSTIETNTFDSYTITYLNGEVEKLIPYVREYATKLIDAKNKIESIKHI